MAGVTRMPRRRGGVSGVLLILLGAWGGLAPFVGPYFRFAYTPDKAWAYTSGRLWLSVVPGAAAVVGGFLVAGAARRALGGVGAFLAALGGAWFIVGGSVIALVVKNGSISPGFPLSGPLGSLSAATRVFLEQLAFFTGIGIAILFFGALALGRFSLAGAGDAALADEQGGLSGLVGGAGEPYRADQGRLTEEMGYPATASRPPAAGDQYPAAPEQAAPTVEQYPTSTSPFQRQPPADPGPPQGPG